ncbi:hypothetical protein D6C95_06632 [Aureobasidium pullulans]|nr:hypothetical protein D6C95_06632 [Aureobasidium pullulans]
MTAGQVCLLLVTNDEVKEWNSRPTRGLGPELKRNRTLGVRPSYTRRYGRVAVWVTISLDISVDACGLIGAVVLHCSGDPLRKENKDHSLYSTCQSWL